MTCLRLAVTLLPGGRPRRVIAAIQVIALADPGDRVGRSRWSQPAIQVIAMADLADRVHRSR
jgi:hypothetical protein